jgi:hypothetical protein
MIGVSLLTIQTILNGIVFHNQDLWVGKGRRFLNATDDLPTCVEESSEISSSELVFRLGAALLLLVLSGTFSGLTLGLLGLDITGLDVRNTHTLLLQKKKKTMTATNDSPNYQSNTDYYSRRSNIDRSKVCEKNLSSS